MLSGAAETSGRAPGHASRRALTLFRSHDPQLALSLKSQANSHFTASRYREALDMYTASLNKNPFDPIVWSNRAAVRLKLEEHGLAIADSSESLSNTICEFSPC